MSGGTYDPLLLQVCRARPVFTVGNSCDVTIDMYIFRNLKCITVHRIYA
jgi:hypothetical protein